LVLFVGSLREATDAWVLFSLFGGAVICALGGVAAFAAEMMLAGIAIRREVAAARRPDDDAAEAEPHPPDAEPPPDDPGPSDSL
jgi:hypothetical protein